MKKNSFKFLAAFLSAALIMTSAVTGIAGEDPAAETVQNEAEVLSSEVLNETGEPGPQETEDTTETAVSETAEETSEQANGEEIIPETEVKTEPDLEKETGEPESNGIKPDSKAVSEAKPVVSEKSDQSEIKDKQVQTVERQRKGFNAVFTAQSDYTTTLPDGEYTVSADDFLWSGGTGKARLTLDKVVVSGGTATGYFTASSANMTHVFYAGHTPGNDEDPAYYDPNTGAMGDSVAAISEKKVSFPVKLNTTVEIACRSTAMSEPHWINYSYKITLDGTQQETAADYTAVDAALAKVPEDLSIYTEDSAAAVLAAIAAVDRTKTSNDQAAVDAMAKAIEDAVDALVLKPMDPQTVELAITNNTNMFKAVSAQLDVTEEATTLVMALSGTGYRNLFKGTYEEAVANGANTANWISGYQNAAGKWEFSIPIEDGENYVPCVAISESYYQGFLKGQNPIERAFYPRQVQIDVQAKTLTTGDYEYSKPLNVTNNAKMFKVAGAALDTVGGPNSNGYRAVLDLTMGSDAFSKAYVGTAGEAAAADSVIEIQDGRLFEIPVKWVETFGDPTTLKSLTGKAFIISFFSVKNQTWYEREFLIDEEAGTLTVNSVQEGGGSGGNESGGSGGNEGGGSGGNEGGGSGGNNDSGNGGNNGGSSGTDYPANTDGSTGAVDSSTGLADGTYTPDSFSFSGGTGRVQITCTKIVVKGGKAYATIVFSSSKYGYVKAAGGTYYPVVGNGTTTFEIPVELNKNNTIIGMTTAMSAPHEITYTIFPYLAAAEGKTVNGTGSGSSASGVMTVGEVNKMDEEAPVIAGLSAEGSGKAVTEHAEYIRIFDYEDNIKLVEIDMRKDTVLDKDYIEKHKDSSEEKKTAETENIKTETEAVINDDSGDKTEEKTKEEFISELYEADVIKYLVVPEDTVLPAGIEKQIIVVQLPKKNLCVNSEEALNELEQLDLLKNVKAVGTKEKDTENKTIKKGLKDKSIVYAGDYSKPDYKTMVKNKVDLVLASGNLVPLNDDVKKERNIKDSTPEQNKNLTADEYKDRLFEITSRYATLDIPMIMDRSADEKSDAAKAEWLSLYGIMFGKTDEASALIAKAAGTN